MTKSRRLQSQKSLRTTISNSMKLAESSLEWVENTVGKGDIASNEQISPFPTVF